MELYGHYFNLLGSKWTSLPSIVGLFIILKHSMALLRWIYAAFFRPPRNLKARYGSWAIITGCTDGIGREFALHLARTGLNLVLVSRNQDKLNDLSKEICSNNSYTTVKTVVLDFSDKVRGSGYKEIEEMVSELDVGILINNVGVTYPAAMFFHEVDEEVWTKIVRVNIESTVRVTKAVLPEMVRRKKGAVLNIGSGAGIVVPSHPLYAIYAATKAFVDQFSRSLYVEYKSQGIDVQCQVPLYVATKMTFTVASIDKTSMFVPSASDYVEDAVRRIGYESRCTPYWTHTVQWFFARLLPEFVLDSWRLSIGLRRRGKTYFRPLLDENSRR